MGKGRCSIRCSGTERIMEADISMQCRKKKYTTRMQISPG
uniref:Uncharacterized protein n=1 Tax=Arundo donax TaxID=35708 RepID=A0A0A9H428_ARUDO